MYGTYDICDTLDFAKLKKLGESVPYGCGIKNNWCKMHPTLEVCNTRAETEECIHNTKKCNYKLCH